MNTEISNSVLKQFCASYNLTNLIKEPTYFESVDNPFCIDLMLTNHPKCFQNFGIYETGISDFHKLTFTFLKTYFQKRIIKYRDSIQFNSNEFRGELIMELSSNNMQSDNFARFTGISKMILEKKVPLKKRYVRYNQAKFMNKNLQNAIMNRSRLLNRYRKEKAEATKPNIKDSEIFV